MIPELLAFALLAVLAMLALIGLSEPETLEQRARRKCMTVYCDAKECVCCRDGICKKRRLRIYDGSCGSYKPAEWKEDAQNAQAENAGETAGDL